MSLIELFFTQTVTIRPFIRQGAGEPIYGAPETRKCRLESKSKLKPTYKNPRGVIDQIPKDTRMYCVGSIIPDGSIVTYRGIEFVVTDCRVLNGFVDDHLEVILQ